MNYNLERTVNYFKNAIKKLNLFNVHSKNRN